MRAALAVFERRREDIVEVAFTRAAAGEARGLLDWAARARRPAQEVSDVDLERFANANHHEGLCVAARPRRWATPAELAERLVSAKGLAVALDRVRNPYNVGAILRTAAFFGVDAALLGAPAPHPALAPDAVRVAEGGAEHLMLARTTDLADTLGRLRSRGVRVVGADRSAPTALGGAKLDGPLVLVVGHEREGMGPRVRAACDEVVAIRGSGHLDSLNVAVAAGVLIAAARDAHGARPTSEKGGGPGVRRP